MREYLAKQTPLLGVGDVALTLRHCGNALSALADSAAAKTEPYKWTDTEKEVIDQLSQSLARARTFFDKENTHE